MTSINIKKLLPLTTLVLGLAFGISAIPVFAQTNSSVTGMATFYTATGAMIHENAASIPVGHYFTANGDPLYYYGNGIYYNATTQTYGDVYVPGFVSATYPGSSMTTAQATTPGVPDTGLGGEAPLNWTLLALSACITLAGIAYFIRRQVSLQHASAK